MDFENLVGECVPLLVLGAVDHVGQIFSLNRFVGRDRDDFETVDFPEFVRLGHGGSGHAGELAVEPKKVLEGDRSESLVLILDLEPLFCFHCSTAGPPSAGP